MAQSFDTPTLYLIGTPIGNLGDLSLRAAETLRAVDFIAAEDTRVTLKLLNHLGIKKPLISYYQHNIDGRSQHILDRIHAGESGALVSDAGMPAISDPGELLIAMAHEQGIPVTAVPGPTAALTALALSGLPTGRFTFEGFLSTNPRNRRAHLKELHDEQRTMIFYEAPHKLLSTLADLLAELGDRPIVLARELTKLHEELLRTTLSGALAHYAQLSPRGEFVLLLAGAEPEAPEAEPLESVAARAEALMADGLPASAAAKEAAKGTPYGKSEVYRAICQAEDETKKS